MPRRIRSVKGLVAGVAVAAVAAAIVIDTPFLTPEEAQAINPPQFSAEGFAQDAFPEVTEAVSADATDLAEVVQAYTGDPEAAGKEFGTALGGGKFVFPVSATGTVSEADANFLRISVPGVPPEAAVRVAVGSGISGTAIRDVTGKYTFSEFPGQTEYQSAANAFKGLVQSEVVADVDPAATVGKEITVEGVWPTGGPPNSYVITPTSIEVAS